MDENIKSFTNSYSRIKEAYDKLSARAGILYRFCEGEMYLSVEDICKIMGFKLDGPDDSGE